MNICMQQRAVFVIFGACIHWFVCNAASILSSLFVPISLHVSIWILCPKTCSLISSPSNPPHPDGWLFLQIYAEPWHFRFSPHTLRAASLSVSNATFTHVPQSAWSGVISPPRFPHWDIFPWTLMEINPACACTYVKLEAKLGWQKSPPV